MFQIRVISFSLWQVFGTRQFLVEHHARIRPGAATTSKATHSPIKFTIRGFQFSANDVAFVLQDFMQFRFHAARRTTLSDVMELAKPIRPRPFTKGDLFQSSAFKSQEQSWITSVTAMSSSVDFQKQLVSLADLFAIALGRFLRFWQLPFLS